MPNAGFLSEVSRMLRLAEALRARGEPVALATHGGPYLPQLQASGLPLTVLEPVTTRERYEAYLRDLCQIGRPGVRLQPPEEVRASVTAETAFLRRVGARAVVIGFTLTAYLSSRVAGVPLVASHGGSYVPPLFERGLAPAPVTMPIPHTEWLPAPLKRWMANHGASRMRDPVVFLNTVARELGVEPVPTLGALMLGDLTLVTDVPEVLGVPEAEMQAWRPRSTRQFRAGTRLVYSGPLFARLPLPVPETIRPFLDGSRPTACVVLSSSNATFLRGVVQQVRAAGLRVIVGATIHDHGPNDDPDVVVAGVMPNHEVLPKVDLAVCMGGQGTVQTCMTSGTPFVGIPLHPEQELNVALAERQGAALRLAPRHATGPAMTAAVRRLLSEPSFKAGALRAQRHYAGIDGAARGAEAMLSWLAERPVPEPSVQPQAA